MGGKPPKPPVAFAALSYQGQAASRCATRSLDSCFASAGWSPRPNGRLRLAFGSNEFLDLPFWKPLGSPRSDQALDPSPLYPPGFKMPSRAVYGGYKALSQGRQGWRATRFVGLPMKRRRITVAEYAIGVFNGVMLFVETPTFTRLWVALRSDEEYHVLQNTLLGPGGRRYSQAAAWTTGERQAGRASGDLLLAQSAR